MNKRKIISETKAIIYIVLTGLLVKVTVLEAYIVPTGSMENTIMTGDFLIGSRFVYGMRTPDWLGIPYTDIGFFIPYYKFPEFKLQPAATAWPPKRSSKSAHSESASFKCNSGLERPEPFNFFSRSLSISTGL